MKKIVLFFAMIIIVVCGVSNIFLNYKANYNTSKKANLEFENYLNVEVSGTDLVTVMNRAIDNNEKNEVEKNTKGIYKDNEKNSMSIEVKITDNDTIYQMETFDKSGMQKFLANYGSIKFKCTSIEYHQSTKKVKYMLFEQISN